MNRDVILDNLKSYDLNFSEERLNKAIDFAIHYHGSQTRESGEPYYEHPLEVAEIVVSMRLDSNAVITALLHDTVEDTELTLDEIRHHFGDEVAKLVDGVTKLSKIEFMPDNVRQAENFRKLLLAMSDDIRVLLVKLADRLHNMRTIDSIKSPEKRSRIALETQEIYAPLAERIGIQQIRGELQDICFRVLSPDIRDSIAQRLKAILSDKNHLVDEIVDEIKATLIAQEINGKVYGRFKTIYSIWMKMQQKNVGLEQLYDIIAFRIIVDNIPECYKVLGLIHTKYKMVPETFQDFISTPKNNDYQSIHTVVIGPLNQKIEIQIRTSEMHEIAELGVAAHWRYKQRYTDIADGKQYRWIRELLAILDQTTDSKEFSQNTKLAEEFLQNTKLAMYYDQVFCFSPKGNLIALPRGATPIDFAYAVHSDVGHHCIGSKVNGRTVPLKSILQNGDQVEIITVKHQTPSPSWEKFVVTGKARSEIRRFIRTQQRCEYIKLGKAILDKAFEANYIKDIDKALKEVCMLFKARTADDLHCAVGDGTISREELIKQIANKKNKIKLTLSLLKFLKNKAFTNDNSSGNLENNAISIAGMISGIVTHFAECCNPIYGDNIVGVLQSGSGITIHIANCGMLDHVFNKSSIMNLTWDSSNSAVVSVYRLKAIMYNEPGSLATLTTEIARAHGNITNMKITDRSCDFYEAVFDVELPNAELIDSIINSLQSTNSIHYIEKCNK